MERTPHTWKCLISDPETGEQKTVEARTYSDPTRDDASRQIALAAAAEATVALKRKYIGVSAELVEA